MNIVKKTWGNELVIVNNELYCSKIMTLKKDCCCSVHYHKIKTEDFYILEGKIKLELLGNTIIMKKGDTIHIEPLGVHRFTGIVDSKILEISTHHEDSDSYRILQ